MKLIGRGSERGPGVLSKQGLKLLERENIPGACSKAPPRNLGNLHFLRRVRFRHNTRLSCCTCHCISLLKYLVQSKGLSVMYRSSRNALGLCFFYRTTVSKIVTMYLQAGNLWFVTLSVYTHLCRPTIGTISHQT